MTDSREKRLETWDDVRDAFDNLLKRRVDRYVWHRDTLRRYKEGRLGVHLHFCAGGRVYCLEVSHPRELTQDRVRSVDHLDQPSSAWNSEDKGGHPVLVFVHEMVEPVHRFVPAVVRLNRLDLVNRTCGNAKIRQGLEFLDEVCVLSVRVDRERGVPVSPAGERTTVVGLNQLPNDVVQRCSDIAENIAHDQAEIHGRLTDVGLGRPNVLHIIFGPDDGIRLGLQIGSEFGLERVQMLLSPDDFEPGVV